VTRTIGDLARLRKRELFRKLGYMPHPGQTLVHRSRAQRRVLACGTRWGKSTCGAMECVAALMEPRESALGWLVAPTYELTRRIFEMVVRVIRSHFAHRIRAHNPREHSLVVTNLGGGTSELRAKSADRPESLLGESLSFLILDEASSVRDDVWDSFLAPRLLDLNGWALLISTPHARGWFYEQWRRGQKNRDAAYESWQAPTIQNPHIKSELIEAERARLDPDRFAEQYEAKFLGPPEPCDVCGGPSPTVSGLTVYFGDEEPRHCVACGREVDKKGRTVVALCEGEEVPVNRLYVNDGTFDDDEGRTIYRDFGPQATT
jgi:Terminase large subunit, T4likevirus-type, N-terminal